MTNWFWDSEDNPTCTKCCGEVLFFWDFDDTTEFGMCMTCCEPWEESCV